MRPLLFDLTVALLMLALAAVGHTQTQQSPPIGTAYAVTATPRATLQPPTPKPVYMTYLPTNHRP